MRFIVQVMVENGGRPSALNPAEPIPKGNKTMEQIKYFLMGFDAALIINALIIAYSKFRLVYKKIKRGLSPEQ